MAIRVLQSDRRVDRLIVIAILVTFCDACQRQPMPSGLRNDQALASVGASSPENDSAMPHAGSSASVSITPPRPLTDSAKDSTEELDAPTSTERHTARRITFDEVPEVADITERANDAVVYVVCLDAMGNEVCSGSGFVIDESGLVATNYHVLACGVRGYAQFKDGRKYEIDGYRAYDVDTDLAIFQLKDVPAHSLAHFALAEPRRIQQGSNLSAVGHPAGFQFTVTTGIVSAVRTTSQLPLEYREALPSETEVVWIQTSAAISAGSSGGPLFDEHGDVIGINSWIASGENLGFAVHIKHLIELYDRVAESCSQLPFPGLGLFTDPTVVAITYDYASDLNEALSAATSEGRARRILKKTRLEYAERLLGLAERDPTTETACQALCQAVRLLNRDERQMTRLDRASSDVLRRTLELIRAHHIDDPYLAELSLALIDVGDSELIALQQLIIEKNNHRTVRGITCISLAKNLCAMDANDQLDGKALYAVRQSEVRSLLRLAIDEYGNETVRGMALADIVEPMWIEMSRLSIGSEAQNISGTDMDGKHLELADYRGKVVLLDFWADWCPHCRDQYAVNQKLLDRFAEDSFELLGVNADQVERAQQVHRQGLVTWPSWCDGPEGEICQQWQIEAFPTTYLLDRKGVIRFINLSGRDLERAIELLLREQEIVLNDTIVNSGSIWRYQHGGHPPVSDWNSPSFDDSRWQSASAPIGYGHADLTTQIATTPIGITKPMTAYFRHRFEVTDPNSIETLLLSVNHDDGVAVYLNGQEVVRWNLENDADHHSEAMCEVPLDGKHKRYVLVDPSLLQAGENVLAAEVHQAGKWSADLRFDAALSRNPWAELNEQLDNENAPYFLNALDIVADLQNRSESVVPRLHELSGSDDALTAMTAFFALVSIAPDRRDSFDVPPLKRWSDAGTRKMWAKYLNNRAWKIVRNPDRSSYDYYDAYGCAALADRLNPNVADVKDTLALSCVRLGRFEEAVREVKSSIEIAGSSPVSSAILAMAQHHRSQLESMAERKEGKQLIGQSNDTAKTSEDIEAELAEAAMLASR